MQQTTSVILTYRLRQCNENDMHRRWMLWVSLLSGWEKRREDNGENNKFKLYKEVRYSLMTIKMKTMFPQMCSIVNFIPSVRGD